MRLPDGTALTLRWAGATDAGRKRENNQDSLLTLFPMFIVADGMGGHIGGEIASQSVVGRLAEIDVEQGVTPDGIDRALALAVQDIADHPDTTDEGTGTTLTGIYLDGSADGATVVAMNIGDSRVYLQRGDQLMQVTTDHSLVQELVQQGRLSEEEAESHPYSNVITRAVGPGEQVAPDFVRIDVQSGDRYVICSDGLTKELTDYGILHFLHENADPADAVAAMMRAALDNGGRDNVSIIVVDILAEGAETELPEGDTLPREDEERSRPVSPDAA